jgi:hypothetical protein
MKRFLLTLLMAQAILVFPVSIYAQMKIDLPADTLRKLANVTYLDDLAIHDTALIAKYLCIDNGAIFVPGWTTLADLGNAQYQASGVMLRVEVLPGKKLKGTLIDAAQAQAVAKGRPNVPGTLSTAEYNNEVITYVDGLYKGGGFGIETCEEERRQNPLRTLNLFSLESINGFTKISDLIASVTPKQR